MFRPVTKWAVQITQPDRIPELLRAALRTAMSGRRGPVLVEIPRDVLNATVSPSSALPPSSYRSTHPPVPSDFVMVQLPSLSISAIGKPTCARSGTSLNPGSA